MSEEQLRAWKKRREEMNQFLEQQLRERDERDEAEKEIQRERALEDEWKRFVLMLYGMGPE